MSNPFAWTVDWQALATLLTGFAAVGGAVWVGFRQLQLRRDESRLTLFEQRGRHGCLTISFSISAGWCVTLSYCLQRKLKAAEKGRDKREQISDRLPQLEELLVQATRVGHMFR